MNNSITKRKDGRFMGRFVIGRRDNGKLIYQYVYGKSYDEALRKVQIGTALEERYKSTECKSISELYREWLTAVRNRVKESTYVNYRSKFEKHILPELGNTPCVDITAKCINVFVDKMLAKGYSASYIRDIVTVFKSMLIYAHEEYGYNFSLKNISLPKKSKKNINKLDDDEQKRLVYYLKEHMDRYALGILLSLYMGLRIGELCGLKWSDVDLKSKRLYVRCTVQRIGGEYADNKKTKIVISSPKSENSFRVIAIPDFLAEYLEMLKRNDGSFILSGNERIIEPRAFQYHYKKILSASGVTYHNFHQLRHTFATNCVQNGFDVKTLSQILGHKTVNITLNRYVHPDNTHERKLMNTLALLF